MAQAEADRTAAARFISSTVPRFRDELGREQTLRAFEWVRWTDLADNVRFFGTDGSKPGFDRVYNQADAIWMNYPQAEIKDRFAPLTLRDDRILRRIWDTSGRKTVARAEKYGDSAAFTGTAVITKPISINFLGGSADLDAEAMAIVNTQLLPQVEMARGMYLRVEGNTDSTGSSSTNQKLSENAGQGDRGLPRLPRYRTNPHHRPRQRCFSSGSQQPEPRGTSHEQTHRDPVHSGQASASLNGPASPGLFDPCRPTPRCRECGTPPKRSGSRRRCTC